MARVAAAVRTALVVGCGAWARREREEEEEGQIEGRDRKRKKKKSEWRPSFVFALFWCSFIYKKDVFLALCSRRRMPGQRALPVWAKKAKTGEEEKKEGENLGSRARHSHATPGHAGVSN